MSESLQNRIDQCALVDRHKLRAAFVKFQSMTAGNTEKKRTLQQLKKRVVRSLAECEQRRKNIPQIIAIPGALPIASTESEIVELISNHQVIVVAGETGSGKTTQLPKMCLQAGLGRFGLIGHTQPRRLAAVSVANRIAEELGTEVGNGVGYQVRFNDSTSASTYLKLMTDGILLNEIQQDKYLNKYEVLIIDEAHERSLNIDFILGYLKQLLPRRPELKVVITSATIDLEKFSQHFDSAPIVAVSGRTYPVEVRYAPFGTTEDAQTDADPQTDAIVDAIWKIHHTNKNHAGPGDVLVFLSSEKEIRETALVIRQQKIPHTEVLPLYARLGQSEQVKIFKPHQGRRIILATNIAETSLTVPGIKYVVDTGFARISRYSVQSKIQRLPIEPISKASANQRMGRCGRVSDGVCIRLYAEEDFQSRTEFTDPEIRRTNLAAVILQMISLKIGDVKKFPFMEKPEGKAINDGYKLLFELGAIDEHRGLTSIGRDMSRLPVDPRLARMLIAGGKHSCLQEILIIVSGLSIQDPRETPVDKRQHAQEKHRQFAHPDSDFLSLVNLWHEFEQRRQDTTQSQLRKYCKQNYLSYRRMREWRETHRQLVTLCHQLKLARNKSEASYRDTHSALLVGSLNQIGCQSEGAEYLGSRNRKFRLLPSSSLAKKPGKWIISNQIIETEHAFSTGAARVEPEWIESAASHLTRKSWDEPHWSKKQQQVMAYEKITLYGLVIIEKKKVSYSAIDPKLCRSLFIQQALLGQQLDVRLTFYQHNCALIRTIEKQEEKLRKQSYFLDDKRIERYYDERIPPWVNDRASLIRWYHKESKVNDSLLQMRLEEVIPGHDETSVKKEFPDKTTVYNNALAIEYQFDPGSSTDGATIEVPEALLGQLQQSDLDWAVPGQLKERCTYLLKSLPKAIRKNLIPIAEFVDQAVLAMEEKAERSTLLDELILQARSIKSVELKKELLNQVELPEFLRVKLKIVDDSAGVLATGSNLGQLQKQFGLDQIANTSQVVIDNGSKHPIECDGLTDWLIDDFPEKLEVGDNLKLIRYPTLVDKGGTVSLRLFADKEESVASTRQGLTKLYMLRTRQQKTQLSKQFTSTQRSWGLKRPQVLAGKGAIENFGYAVYCDCFGVRSVVPRNKQQFEEILLTEKGRIFSRSQEISRALEKTVESNFRIVQLLNKFKLPHQHYLVQDIQKQLGHLLSDDFLSCVEADWLIEYPRYLQAIEYRLEKYSERPGRDQQYHEQVDHQFNRLLNHCGEGNISINARVETDAILKQIRWMIEEYRVSVFAQHLKTKVPVSSTRLNKLWSLFNR